MTALRLATFNVENLFSRSVTLIEDREGKAVGMIRFDDPAERDLAHRVAEAVASDDKRQLTALALVETNADIIALQEVDSREALEIFYKRYVKRMLEPKIAVAKRDARARLGRDLTDDERYGLERRFYYDHRVLLEGNDGRGIDVALLSRHPVAVKSHAHRTFTELGVWTEALAGYFDQSEGRERPLRPSDRVFRRDCLEVTLEAGSHPITLFVCHFKSMASNRERTRALREAEAKAVRRIIEQAFSGHARQRLWAICGDLNDHMEIDGTATPGALDTLMKDGFAVNLMTRRPAQDRWTTYHGEEDQYAQLDYILASPALATLNPHAVPDIIRAGQPYRSARYDGPRYPRIGHDRPKASDHCPVAVTLKLG